MLKLSVIVPCYGVEKYLDRCMRSLTMQSLRDFEIILVDDESPDRVPEMCDQWALLSKKKIDAGEYFPVIKVVHKKNGGLGFARNSGLEVATGEYVAFVDSDDFVDTNMYATLYEKAKETRADAVYCNCSMYKDDKHISPRKDVCEETVFSGRKAVDQFLLDIVGPEPSYPHDVKYMMSVWHAVYKKSIFDEFNIRFVSERDLISEDLVFDIDYLPHCSKVVYLPDCFYFYCDNGASLSRKVDEKKFTRTKFFVEEIEKKMKGLFADSGYKSHLYRLKFFYLRYFLQCSKKNLIAENISSILKDPFWDDLFSEYTWLQMDLKRRLFFFCCQKKLTFILKCIL